MAFARHRQHANRVSAQLDPYQRVAHAVIAQAMDDAERGEGDAYTFLFDPLDAEDLAFWAGVLGVTPDAIRCQFARAYTDQAVDEGDEA